MTTIHYLGPAGTFSELAAQTLGGEIFALIPETARGGCSLVPQPTLARAMAAVDDDNNFAVVPYYNLIEGLIQETLDLVIERRLAVLAARQIPVQFAIGGYLPENAAQDANAEMSVFSYPKALAQCSDFLLEHFPGATLCETSSTAQATRQVAESRTGLVIARRETLESLAVPVLHDDIGNRQYSRRNYTEFLLVGRPESKPLMPTHPSPTSHVRTLIAILPAVDRVGLLADILGQIAFFGINLLKIHSRPALADDHAPAPQMFYLETDVAVDSPELRLCIETLNMRLARQGDAGDHPGHQVVRLLGTYLTRTI